MSAASMGSTIQSSESESLRSGKRIPAYASPARREDYSGLPPRYTFVGDIEPFYRETLDYVANLQAAGVKAEVDVYKGLYHAYDMMEPDTAEARKAADRFVEKFKAAKEDAQSASRDRAIRDRNLT